MIHLFCDRCGNPMAGSSVAQECAACGSAAARAREEAPRRVGRPRHLPKPKGQAA